MQKDWKVNKLCCLFPENTCTNNILTTEIDTWFYFLLGLWHKSSKFTRRNFDAWKASIFLNTIFCFLCIIVGNKPGLELIKKAWKCLFVIKTGGCADTNQLISKSLEPQSCNLIGQLPFASFCTFSSQSLISPHIIIKSN